MKKGKIKIKIDRKKGRKNKKKGGNGKGDKGARGPGAKKERKKEERTTEGSIENQKTVILSILSVPQIMCPDFSLCDLIRHNQDEPQWIVAQRLLSALTTPEVFESSANELSF